MQLRHLKMRGRVLARSPGFTLVELLVGLTVGAIVLIGVIFSWGLAVRNNVYVLSVTALNNDMRSLMQIVTQDVRRATVEQENDLLIHISPAGDCITFNAAFAQASGAPDELVPSGYRLVSGSGAFQVWTGGLTGPDTCDDDDADPGWEDLIVSGDRGVVLETFAVDFSRSRCLDLDDEDAEFGLVQDEDSGEITCDTEAIGNRFVQLWLIDFTLSGRLDLAPMPREFEFVDAVKIRSDAVVN